MHVNCLSLGRVACLYITIESVRSPKFRSVRSQRHGNVFFQRQFFFDDVFGSMSIPIIYVDMCVCVFFFSLKYAYRASDLLVSKVQRGQIEWPKHTWIFLSKSYNYNSCHGGHFIAHIHHFCWNNKHLKPGNQSKGPKYPVSRVLRSGVCVRSTAHSG